MSLYYLDNFQVCNNPKFEKHIDEKHRRALLLTRLGIARTGTENLTGSRFVSPCDGAAARPAVKLSSARNSARESGRVRELSRHAGCHIAGRQNFIIELQIRPKFTVAQNLRSKTQTWAQREVIAFAGCV